MRGTRCVLLGLAVGLSIALLSCGRKKEAPEADDLLARVGEQAITVQEFVGRLHYALLPGGGKQSLDVSSRRKYLDDLIDEKLAARAARARGLDREANLLPTLEEVRDQAMLRELYLDRIRAQVVLPEEEVELALKRATEELEVAFFRAAHEDEALWVKQKLLEGRSFAEVAAQRYGRSFSEEQFRRTIRWGETEPALEEVAYALKVGEVSEPVPVEGGYYVLKLLRRSPLGVEKTPGLRSAVEQRLRQRKEAQLARQYTDQILRASRVGLYRGALDRLAGTLETRLEKEPFPLEIDPSWLDSLADGLAWGDTVLLEIGDQRLSVRQVLSRLARSARMLRFDSVGAVRPALASLIVQLAQDEALLREARRLGLQDHPRVKRDVAIWEDYLLAQILRDRLGDEMRFRSIVDSLRAAVPVMVLETKLAALDLAPLRQTPSSAWAARSVALPPWPGD
ncbi:MAG: peptidyl-prolyl cis-trans isomerase [candidate division KSB1 bacterium]|nr:peptidyl-prolyl cis-trans isomerase [candidate division KSB1 bacterium]